MTAIAFTAEPTVSLASRVAHVFAQARSVWTAHRARRTRRIALMTLVEFESHRLDDLGISINDVAEALRTAR